MHRKTWCTVYVRHEIVHNQFVVRALEAKGAIFVEELDQIPDGFPVIFSAHGVPKSIPEEANKRGLYYVDATCPLVSKVHIGAERHYKAGRHILHWSLWTSGGNRYHGTTSKRGYYIN